ncbi:hypothetical protein JCM16303_002177 [Sporobolomyces ruberrimus]
MSVFKRNTNKETNEKNGGFTNQSSPEGSQLEWTGAGELPEGAATNAEGIPTFMGASGNKLNWLVTVAASAGFDMIKVGAPRSRVMSGIISAPQFFETFPACDPAAQGKYQASILQALYVAIYEIGCLAGAIFALMFGDKLGRRKMMFAGATILTFGVLIQVTCFSGHWAGGQFIIGRIVTGLGTGFLTSTIPTWHAECAKAKSRGFAVFIEAAMVSLFHLIAPFLSSSL